MKGKRENKDKTKNWTKKGQGKNKAGQGQVTDMTRK